VSLKLIEAIPMQAMYMMMEDEQGKRQLFLRAWLDEYCIIFQCNPEGEQALKLNQEETDRYEPIFQRALTEHARERAEACGINFESLVASIRQEREQESFIEALEETKKRLERMQ